MALFDDYWLYPDLNTMNTNSSIYATTVHRLLQDNTTSSSTDQSDSIILRTTFKIYGSILVISFLLFCYVRRRYPRSYNLRDWVDELKTPLAEDQYGFFSWMWKMNSYTDDEILEDCGMDSLCYLRLLYMGYRICAVGALNAIWLMPIYKYASNDDDTTTTPTDRAAQVTVSNVPPGSPKFIATVIATYVLFGYIMYLILEEFTWFTEFRHKYLRKAKPRNYSIFVRNIPTEYRSNEGFEIFLKQCFASESIVQANLRVKAPTLLKAVSNRDTIISKFDHSLAYEQMTGKEFVSRTNILGSKNVRALKYLADELKQSNDDIAKQIMDIEAKMKREGEKEEEYAPRKVFIPSTPVRGDVSVLGDSVANEPLVVNNNVRSYETIPNDEELVGEDVSNRNLFVKTYKGISSKTKIVTSGVNVVTSGVTSGVNIVASGALDAANSGLNLLKGIDEGEYYDAGFASFTNLCTTNAALQMVHDAKPFDIEVLPAPDPEDIFWENIGRSHKDVQVGRLVSMVATTALCIFWTIPMSFISNLSQVSQLKSIPFVANMIEAVPALEPILQQLAPLLLIIVNSLLPVILQLFSMREGPVSKSIVEASLFTKLAAFAIIQTFFVSFIGGSLTSSLQQYVENPLKIIDFLATTLPAKSTFFMQLVFVSNAISLTLEMLRVVPLIMAWIRSYLSPNLTEKERRTPVFIFNHISDPGEFGTASNLSNVILAYMVILVYAVIAPLSSFILGFCFAYMHVCFKHQLFYIYPPMPDSGGKIWTDFIRIMMTCMLVAQITILGLMGLKKAAIGAPLMFPLIVITFLFNAYVRQQHFRVTAFLPSRDCLKMDLRNGPDFDLSFLKNAYLQGELENKYKYPDLTPMQRVWLEQQGIEISFEANTDAMSTAGTAFENNSRASNQVPSVIGSRTKQIDETMRIIMSSPSVNGISMKSVEE